MESIPDSSNWDIQRLTDLLRADRDRSIIAATPDGRLVGFAAAYVSEGLNPFMYRERVVVLRRLLVATDYRGRGIGSELLRRTFRAADGLAVAWQTTLANTAALKWLSHRGIEPCGSITRGLRTDRIYVIAEPPIPLTHDATND
jgi:GNAT superfamily N-acetyltransferase